MEDHFRHVAKFLRFLKKARLSFKLSKCGFSLITVTRLENRERTGKSEGEGCAIKFFKKLLSKRNDQELGYYIALCNVYSPLAQNLVSIAVS